MKSLELAKKYHELGFSIIPIRPKSKVPAIPSWKQYQDRKPSLDEIENWFEDGINNIAVICGPISSVAIVDVDDPKHPELSNFDKPSTASVTTSKGYHLYYRLSPNKKLVNKKLPWGDIKAEGGYVVAPPSVHESGVQYEWNEDISSVDELAEFPYHNFDQPYVDTKPLYQVGLEEMVNEGGRNLMLTSLCGKLIKSHKQKDWEGVVWPLLLSVNKTKCNPPEDEQAVRSIFESIVGKERSSHKTEEKVDFVITTADDIRTKEIKEFPYVVDKIVPEGGITAISAGTGAGKSLFALILLGAIGRGDEAFELFKTKKTKVLIIDQEMDEDLIIGRYKGIVPEGSEIDVMYEQDWSIDNDNQLEWLEKQIVEREYGLIVFDTLTTIHNLDENDAGAMRDLNKRMLKLASDRGVTIVYLHHHRKSFKGEKTSNASARGSTEIIAKAASHLTIESKRTATDTGTVTEMVVRQEKARRPESIDEFGLVVTYDAETKETTWVYEQDLELTERAIDKAKRLIPDLLKEQELDIQELIEATELGGNSVRDACKYLVDKAIIIKQTKSGFGAKQFYSLPKPSDSPVTPISK